MNVQPASRWLIATPYETRQSAVGAWIVGAWIVSPDLRTPASADRAPRLRRHLYANAEEHQQDAKSHKRRKQKMRSIGHHLSLPVNRLPSFRDLKGMDYIPEADEIVEQTRGYPYFLQEWGKHSWDIARASPITLDDVRAASTEAIAALDESFFRVRFDRLTPKEKQYLVELAFGGPDLGQDDMKKADRISVELLPFGLVAFHARQTAYAVTLQAPVK